MQNSGVYLLIKCPFIYAAAAAAAAAVTFKENRRC
jgi:hypothetical protein